jgi:hypothetical protein
MDIMFDFFGLVQPRTPVIREGFGWTKKSTYTKLKKKYNKLADKCAKEKKEVAKATEDKTRVDVKKELEEPVDTCLPRINVLKRAHALTVKEHDELVALNRSNYKSELSIAHSDTSRMRQKRTQDNTRNAATIKALNDQIQMERIAAAAEKKADITSALEHPISIGIGGSIGSLWGDAAEGFANQYTNSRPDIENELMRNWWVRVKDESPHTSDTLTILKNDIATFAADISGDFSEKTTDISGAIQGLEKSMLYLAELNDMEARATESETVVNTAVDNKSTETTTNERRTVYEAQLVDRDNRWKSILTVAFIVSAVIFGYYGVTNMIATGVSMTGVAELAGVAGMMFIYVVYVDILLFYIYRLAIESKDAIITASSL